jgi:hypothetical protein
VYPRFRNLDSGRSREASDAIVLVAGAVAGTAFYLALRAQQRHGWGRARPRRPGSAAGPAHPETHPAELRCCGRDYQLDLHMIGLLDEIDHMLPK